MFRTAILVSVALACACGEDYTIQDMPLAGRVGGDEWVFVRGDTNAFLSDERYFANLFASDFEPCGFGAPVAESSVILNLPKSTGEYDLSLNLNMTFVIDMPDGTLNLVGTDGLLRIDEITDTSVSGGVVAEYDGDNSINGTFSVTVCPPST